MQISEDYCFHIQAGLYVSVSDNNKNTIEISPCAFHPRITVSPNYDVFNDSALIEIRKRNSLSGFCEDCTYLEETGQRCPIKQSMHEEEFASEIYNLDGPVFIRFNLDTTCNLACVTCEPTFSSKWRSEEKIKNNPSVSETLITDFFNNVNLKNLRKVQILGGEPFLSKYHKPLLEKLLPYRENLTVSYHTNGTVKVSDDIINLWKLFKKVQLRFSIDAIEKSFDYLRWPANWNEVEDNLFFYKDLNLDNIKIWLTPTVSILNLFSLNDLKFWYIKNYRKVNFTNMIGFEPLPAGGLYSPYNMSQEMINDTRILFENQSSILKFIPSVEKINNLELVKKTLTDLDVKRGLDFNEYLPRLAKYLPK